MFLESPHFVSGYYGTIVSRFKGKIFANDHKFLPYYVSALSYFRIEQFFRAGELSAEYKKARFHLLMMAKMIQMKCEVNPLNSNKIDVQCEEFKHVLLDAKKALELFQRATQIYKLSDIDFNKRQFKSETETEALKKAVETANMEPQGCKGKSQQF